MLRLIVYAPPSQLRARELDLDRRLNDEASYQQTLRKLQVAMLELEEICRAERRRGVIAVEDWDAQGKSGAIQRLIEKLDPAPGAGLVDRPAHLGGGSPPLSLAFVEEVTATREYHDLRPTQSGPVLFERVEAAARPKEWRRAYEEINAFEKMLLDEGIRLVKPFLHISDQKQLRRFRERNAGEMRRFGDRPLLP